MGTDSNQHSSATIAHMQTLIQLQQTVLDHIPEGIIVFEIVSRNSFLPILSNQAAQQMSGFRSSDTLGKTTSTTLSADDEAHLRERIHLCIDSGTIIHVEESASTPNGVLWFDSTFIPLSQDNGPISHVLLLVRNITPDRERALAEQKVIAQQAATLMELSTPLLAISETTVVMPLIGSIDSQRAQQILEHLLIGVAARQSEIVILDITGVPVVDTHVANVLLRASQAVRLLGAQVVLTGIRPEVAQTLVGLGVDLGTIITRGTLRDGIAYALSH